MRIGPGLGLGSGGTVQIPRTVSGLLQWMRGDQVTLTGGVVSTWPNRASSGTANDFAQGMAGLRPAMTTLGGQPALRFANGKTLKCTNLFLNGLAGASLFIVHNSASDPENNGGIVGSDTGVAIELIDLGVGAHRIRVNAGTVTDAGWTTGASAVNSVVFDGAAAGGTATAYKDGTSVASVGALGATLTNAASFHQLGGYFDTFYSDTTIAEVIVYNRALTSGERLKIERYLGGRYGITVA